MNRREVAGAAMAALVLSSGPAEAKKAPATWDGLVQMKSKRLKLVYLQPGADFRAYQKVMLDPTEVAFQKDWRRDYNNTAMGLQGRVSEAEVQKIIKEGVDAAGDIFVKAFIDGGYPVVATAGPDVLRLKTAIMNISVSAPERRMAGRSYTFSDDAGEATFVVEARDSATNALLGRAVDRREAGDTTTGWRNQVSNRADFRRLVKTWADINVKGLSELKALSPINNQGTSSR